MSSKNDLLGKPPMPHDTMEESSRREHTAQRLRLLTGEWREDVKVHRKKHFVETRDDVQGPTDLSTNTLQTYVSEIGQLYARPPEASGDPGSEDLIEAVSDGGWWQLAIRNMCYTLGMNEMLVRPSLSEADGWVFRLVTPDLVYMEASPDNPDLPWYVVEARPREWPIDSGKIVWTWDESDVRGAEPSYRILLPRGSNAPLDITEEIEGQAFEGAAYPYTRRDDRSIVPYTLYHRQRTGQILNPWDGREMVEGTLTVAVLWTLWQHVVRDASWPQRVLLGGYVRGLGDVGKNGFAEHQSVTTDPASILQVANDGTEKASIAQWLATDPKVLGEAIYSFELRLGRHYGMGGDDFQRGAAESGYALSLRRAAVREHQLILEPQFRRADVQLLELCAVIANAGGASYPEDGYRIVYRGLPQSAAEVAAAVDEHERKIGMGVESVVDVYLDEHPDATREEAVTALLEIQAEKRLLGAGVAPPTTGGET